MPKGVKALVGVPPPSWEGQQGLLEPTQRIVGKDSASGNHKRVGRCADEHVDHADGATQARL